ncbi:signal recognition particle receptor, partial [Rhodococcus opacus PD630]
MSGVTTGAWIAIAAALAVLLVVLVVGSLLYRRRRISLKAPDTPQVTTAEKDRSGSYRADGGFNFSQGSTATAPP